MPLTLTYNRWIYSLPAGIVLLVSLSLIAASQFIAIKAASTQSTALFGISFATFYSGVSALILCYKPGSRIGWIMAGIGLYFAFDLFAAEYTAYALQMPSGDLPFLALIQELRWLWMLPVSLLAFLLLLFPNGHLPSRRWLWLGCMAAVPVAVQFVLVLLPDELAQLFSQLLDLVALLLFPALLLSAAALIVRYRRSQGIERQLVKLFAFAGRVFAISIIGVQVIDDIPALSRLARVSVDVCFVIAIASVPLAIALAIFRYRLYDIDLIIRRTLVYGALTVTLALVFFGAVTLLQSMFVTVSGQHSAVATVISTLVIAALFNPLRKRIQREIDRRFFRRKYDAEKVVAVFSASLRQEVDLDDLQNQLLAVVEETLQPGHVSLWMKPPADRGRSSSMQYGQ